MATAIGDNWRATRNQRRESDPVWARAVLLLCALGGLVSVAACATATGSSIVTGTVRPGTHAEDVKLYLEEPKQYKVIGLVEASSDAGWTEQGSQDYAVGELKKQAAKLGANGVLLVSTGEDTSTIIGGYGTGTIWAVPVVAKKLTGKAIYVTEE